jgi:hypothetical protein
MTNVTVSLPDELAQRARRAGLLSDHAIGRLLEDAMRRHAGRKLLKVTQDIRTAGIPPMSDDEIMAEIKAYRAERRRS